MALISLQDITLGFGGPPLFDKINLQIETGQSIGLLGLNGMGKTTLLKLIHDDLSPESGEIARHADLRVAYLPQGVPHGLEGNIRQVVAEGLGDLPAGSEAHWQSQLQVEQVISRMQLDAELPFSLLSAGLKRRVLLARGLVRDPNLLLLDEPTNHLDIDSIDWLENFLKRWRGTLLFVTHDRTFLQRLSNRIIELDRGQLFDWDCDYPTFLKRKEAMLAAQEKENTLFDKKLAQEEAWIRRGIEARRTRNEGRVRALIRLRNQRAQRREQPGKVRMQVDAEQRSGRLIIEAEELSYAFENQPIVSSLNLSIQRGDRLGIIGKNGSGKTTLLRLLLGELKSQSGSLRHGTNLEIAYFDQLRSQIDESKSILENVGEGRDTITINGRERNVVGYLEGFLFSRERIHAPISALSGGERNRLLLARLFARPANLLILDEPTNDLDIETLEILENMLLEYQGTLILVSHDRTFLNNLVTSTLILSGNGRVNEFVGGYDDWESQNDAAIEALDNKKISKPASPTPAEGSTSRKLSYKEQRELEQLPTLIEALEAEQAQLNASLTDPSFYQNNNAKVSQTVERLKVIEEELKKTYRRWEELEQ
ncbi:MAG: ATP-binding cassette domain-containing protein [Anaerolineae bacterium]|jgi:ABC transport system ATP-binding/permease protein|nr:ATP-binding cassette domain-containing protein [Anaerolineae bacterium]MBT7070905.1 ATP-binding cassette domain-containing protein [Anaerolineae bacterium]MBT7324331.1 ATP-binding cassette domain-containing protein [Anaerolineae bacterium]MBT7599798.1 ATP-binding cassette domain-containing protein [Anaerolineae bacterium]